MRPDLLVVEVDQVEELPHGDADLPSQQVVAERPFVPVRGAVGDIEPGKRRELLVECQRPELDQYERLSKVSDVLLRFVGEEVIEGTGGRSMDAASTGTASVRGSMTSTRL